MRHLLRSVAIRAMASFRKQRLNEGLEEECRSHLEFAIERNKQQGMTEEQARREALLAFGGVEQVKEMYRAQGGFPVIETALQDLRYGMRMLRRSPGFTAVTVLSIALGIGANVAIFSLIYALLLRWLPVPDPQNLMQVNIVIDGKSSDSFSYPVIKALAERKDVFANLGGFSDNPFTVGPPSAPVLTQGALVSGGFFPRWNYSPAPDAC